MTWVHVPETACPYAPEAVASTWALCSQSQAFTRDVLSSGSNTPSNALSPPSAPDTSPQPRSGTTPPLSTESPGAGTSTCSPLAILASRLAMLDNAKAQATSATYGQTWPELSMNARLNWYSSKTLKDISASASIPFCSTWSDWVIAMRADYSARRKREEHRAGSGFLSWPAAKALSGGANSQRAKRGAGGPDLQEAAQMWPTMTSMTPAQNGNSAAGNSDGIRAMEAMANRLWTAAQAHDVTERGSGQVPTSKAGNACLARDARMWAAPVASEARQGIQIRRPGTIGTQESLSTQVDQHFHTPLPAQKITTLGVESSMWRPISRRLFRSAMSSVSQTTVRRWLRRGAWRKRRLNPIFVSWLMRWNLGHALCGFWGMGSIQLPQLMHGEAWVSRSDCDLLTLGAFDNAKDLPKLPNHIRSGTRPEQVLQQEMLSREPEGNNGIPAKTHQWEEHDRTPMGYGATSRTATSDIRACSPQEREQDRQSNREPRSSDRSRSHTHPQNRASKRAEMRILRDDVRPGPPPTGPSEDMLKGLSVQTCSTHPQASAFLEWLQHMRTVVSDLPLDSGPWIWRQEETRQMGLFE